MKYKQLKDYRWLSTRERIKQAIIKDPYQEPTKNNALDGFLITLKTAIRN